MKYGVIVPKLKTEDIALCPIRTDDEVIPTYLRWVNNPNISHFIGQNAKTLNQLDEKKWLESLTNTHAFNIVILSSSEMIGNCSLEPKGNAGTYNIGIMIGETDYHNKGYGTQAIKLLVDYAFKELNAHRVELSLSAENTHAFRCYEKCGFVKYGRAHEDRYHDGHYVDTILMEILREES